ncbi:hypothetical protein ACTOB_003815 [Actinoplanes oblitus]|uniref:Uncharacterized protein n=1 Tax=Actinoplanes oblitus TaxID=3040509 RepID=A0ABY8WQE6_9ACTN|nr:hypothetical protein [Actinoplanes oblitus]WIN00130.1 hypothetical protein ACTOB_003815 [Actinoplanes oblitus]
MLTRVLRRLSTPAMIAGLLVGLGATPAMASGTAAGSATLPKYCATFVSPATAANTGAPVVRCSDTSAADARAALPAAAAANKLLMTVYSNAQYRGSTLDMYRPAYCDSYGYDVYLTRYDNWARMASSIRGYQSCNAVGLGSLTGNHHIGHALSWSFGGTVFNDNLNYIHLYSD